VTSIKERLAAGETLYGSFLALGSPLAAEAMGKAGFDWLLVDLEHGGGHESQALAQLIAVQSAGAHALARVESDARSRAGRLLDLGAEGLMCPAINTPAQAQEWIAALHYPPRGSRGVAGFVRGAGYGLDPGAFTREPLGIVQIESVEAVANVEAIAALDGVDVLFVGPNDLTTSMGRFQRYDDPEYREAIARTVRAANDHGKTAGIFFGTPERIPQAIEDGFRMVGFGADASYMLAGAMDALASLKR
jgi:4-hydroxy-2-oxoheptanedioate aldolase